MKKFEISWIPRGKFLVYFEYSFWFLPIYTNGVLALYTQYLREFGEKLNHRHITPVGFEPTTFAILEQCHLLNSLFWLWMKN